jgi:putative membrane protein
LLPAGEQTDAPALGAAPAAPPDPPRLLLQLSLRDLLLLGLLENRGLVLVGAVYGVLWESGVMNRLWSGVLDDAIDVRGLISQTAAFVVGRGPLPTGHLLLAVGGLAAFMAAVRIISMAWAALRLYDFRLTRSGDDLRVTYGFFTRVAATIPVRRVQTVTVRRGWLARRLGRASIRVETAGGRARSAAGEREWIAPILPEPAVPAVLREVLPGVVLPDEGWERVHPRAFRRAVLPVLLVAAIASAVLLSTIGWRPLIAGVPLLAWAIVSTRQQVRRLAWVASDSLIAFRSGWIAQAETIVRANRMQSVTLRESPFDRRARMARVRVDTAGAREPSHRVDIPYLDGAVARALQRRLAGAAARTDFQW